MTYFNCGLTACTQGSAPGPKLSVTSMGSLYLYLLHNILRLRDIELFPKVRHFWFAVTSMFMNRFDNI